MAVRAAVQDARHAVGGDVGEGVAGCGDGGLVGDEVGQVGLDPAGRFQPPLDDVDIPAVDGPSLLIGLGEEADRDVGDIQVTGYLNRLISPRYVQLHRHVVAVGRVGIVDP